MIRLNGPQRMILKIPSSMLASSRWKMSITLDEAKAQGLVILISESTLIRFIDKLRFSESIAAKAVALRREIETVRKRPPSSVSTAKVKKLYQQLDSLIFMPDYISVTMDKISDYRRANKGFSINGISYRRLLATPGGVKNKTIIYVSDELYPKLEKMIDNGRNPDVPLIPAKLEAYRALVCSSSVPVSPPDGVLVVKDCITHFKDSYLQLSDGINGEPDLSYIHNGIITLNDSDGYGLISPSLSRRWTRELGGTGLRSGFCIRNSFCKGMLFTFDFHRFSREVSGTFEVTDVWGNKQDIRDADIVLTASMLKLWNCYESIQQYLSCCEANSYTFSVNKVCPERLEDRRNMNYQFLQSYDFSDDDLMKLVSPTLTEIQDLLGNDYRKSLIFLGKSTNEQNMPAYQYDFAQALAADSRMIDDPFIRDKIHNMIKKRLDEAKIGVIQVSGNFSIVSGDPYSLCQSMFGMEVTGLLKKGEYYSRYWSDKGVSQVTCFRAPMTCHNNIRILSIADRSDMKYWYRYMNTVTIFNSWDTAAHALNGLDKDSDTVLTTDDPVILSNTLTLPAIICLQNRAEKKIVQEKDLVESNIKSFGDEIGSITNTITSQFEKLSHYLEGSPQHDALMYRIRCGQLFQQNSIDKAKGIISGKLPEEWYSARANRPSDTDTASNVRRKNQNLELLSDKKPYFMRYIYPQLMQEYNKYIKNVRCNCLRKFGIDMDELTDKKNKTKDESEFVKDYIDNMPVGTGNCTVNRICRIFEAKVTTTVLPDTIQFDYTIMKSGIMYSRRKYDCIKTLYAQYIERVAEYKRRASVMRTKNDEKNMSREIMKQEFRQEAAKLCSNESELCDIVLDICYTSNNSKQFAWDVCGETIIMNLLEKNGYSYSIPVRDDSGDFEYGGERFAMKTFYITKGGNYGYNTKRTEICG